MPAYRYSEGVRRILRRLHPIPVSDCELLLFDNSPDDQVELVVAAWQKDAEIPVTYHHNDPDQGAAGNWNALLDAAQGEFCWLLHHDEFPLSDRFLLNLIATLRAHPSLDVLMLDCILVSSRTGRNRRHLPTWVRAFVAKRLPGYLLRRNVVGPTAALVARRELYPRFDPQLRWLVDVDAYVRLLRPAKRIGVYPELQIGSVAWRPDSITARLGRSIAQIDRQEREYLRCTRGVRRIWVNRDTDRTSFRTLAECIETAWWALLRGLSWIADSLRGCPVPIETVQDLLRSKDVPISPAN